MTKYANVDYDNVTINNYKTKQDIRGEEKYNLEVEKDGRQRLCYGPFLELLKFKTIKEAQRYVLYNEIAIETMW